MLLNTFFVWDKSFIVDDKFGAFFYVTKEEGYICCNVEPCGFLISKRG